MEIDRKKRTLVNTATGIFYRILSVLLPFVVKSAITYTLGMEYTGLNSLFTSIFKVLNVAELGFGAAIVFSMYRPIAEDDADTICALLRYYRKIYMILGLVLTVLGLLCLPFLPYLVHGDVPPDINMYYLYLLFLFDTVSSYLVYGYVTSLFSAHQRNDILNNANTIKTILKYGLQIAVLFLFKNYYIFVLPMVIVDVLKNFYVYFRSLKMYPQYKCRGEVSKELRDKIKSQVLSLMGHKIGAVVLVSIDSILISSFLGLTRNGIYSYYYDLVNGVILMTNIFTQSLLAGIGNMVITKDKETVYRLFMRLNYAWVWLVGWCAVCLLCLLKPFVLIWKGPGNEYSLLTIIVLVIYYFTWQFRVMQLTFKDAAGLWKKDIVKPYIGLAANFIFSVLLLLLYKQEISVLLPTIFVFICLYFPVETHVVFKYEFEKKSTSFLFMMLKLILILVGSAALTYYLCSFITGGKYFVLIVRAAICVVLPNILFVLLTFRSDGFKYIKNSALKMLKKGKKNG